MRWLLNDGPLWTGGLRNSPASGGTPPVVGDPTVQNVEDGGYIGTTSSIDPATGKVSISLVRDPTVIVANEPTFNVGQWVVRADNIQGKNLAVDVAGEYNFNGNQNGWRAAWAYDLLGPWHQFDADPLVGGITQASNAIPATQSAVYIANKPLMLQAAWDAAIARWKASPHTSPTASGNADWIVGTLPAIAGRAPAKDVHGFRFGTGTLAAVLTTGVHPEEHIGMFAFTSFVDFALSDDPAAVSLRGKFTFHAYPNLNPQARYVGAARAEVETGTALNSNRIWSSDYDHINLSRIMRQIWDADLPPFLDLSLDFHDVPHGVHGAELMHRNGASLYAAVNAIHQARTGRTLVNSESTGTETIGGYLNAITHAAIEHGTLTQYGGVSEWQAWGRDIAQGVNNAYTAAPGAWQEPQWLTGPNVTITPISGGGWTVAGTDVGPKASILIPTGKTIEVIFEGDCSTATGSASAGAFIRQGAEPGIPGGTSTQIGSPIPVGAFTRSVTVTHDPARPYVGVIANFPTGSNPRIMTLTANCRWREVLP